MVPILATSTMGFGQTGWALPPNYAVNNKKSEWFKLLLFLLNELDIACITNANKIGRPRIPLEILSFNTAVLCAFIQQLTFDK